LALSDIRQKLKEMAQLSVFSNRISEIQEKNMKMFPFVFFEEVSTANIDYDLGHAVNENLREVHHKSCVKYHLILKEEANTNNLDKRFLALETSVRELFWKDIKIEIYFNGKQVFESKT
jgi:hypothetical protein